MAYKSFTEDYKQHKAALKYFREQLGTPNDPLKSSVKSLRVQEAVCPIKHGDGMEYEVDWCVQKPWSWLEMVAQLTAESIRIAVKGPEGRSRGLVGCTVAFRPGSYDHKRHHALKMKGASSNVKLPVWDFILHRDDSSAIRLHPQWSNTKVETFLAEGHTDEVEPPDAGLGASDGRGTFKKYKAIGTAGLLRFDGLKRPSPKKATPKAMGKCRAGSSTA